MADLLYLSRADVEAVAIDMADIIALLERMFREKSEGRTEMPPKPGIHTLPDSFLHAMPAHIPAMRSAGLKWVAGYPENQRLGLPYISGLLVLNDPDTGLPLTVMDCTWITAERTAAASAVAARYLARPDSKIVGVLGCGVQGESHVRALQVVLPIERIVAYDPDPGVLERFTMDVRAASELEVTPVTDPRRAVTGCDVVVTAGPILREPHATIRAGWLDPGSFATLVDFDSYWHADALRESDKFCTDDPNQLDYYRHEGYFRDIPPIHAELADLVAGTRPGRETPEERTFACNLGIALEDMAIAPEIYHRAKARNLGTPLPL